MTDEPASRGRFGGLGAVFFLATLGGIAFYVQKHSIPAERDELRKPATAMPEVLDQNAPPPTAWRDRLDLSAIQLAAIATEGAKPAAAPDPAPADPEAPAQDKAKKLEVDAANARYVQDLADGHRLLWTLDPVLQQSALTIFRNRGGVGDLAVAEDRLG